MPALAEPTSVASKEAQVQRVLAQVQELDASLAQAIEAYNAATVKLEGIETELRVNARHLAIARANLRRSQAILSARLVALYTTGEESDALGVVLGATSLNDLLTRLETADRVSDQDARIRRQIVGSRSEMQRRHARLRRARTRQKQLVAERAAHRSSIEQQLAERRSLVASIRSEIERLKEAERRRQAELAAQARERLARQRAAPPLSSGVAAITSSEEATADSVSESAAAVVATPTAAPAARYGGVVAIAMRYLGIPYKWGGASPSTGFDCSGFIMYVYAQVGVSLPHNAAAQYGYGTPVSRGDLQPGDLVFFNGLGHNGIYIGGGQFIHSPHTGDVVKISSMTGWYASTFVGARRL